MVSAALPTSAAAAAQINFAVRQPPNAIVGQRYSNFPSVSLPNHWDPRNRWLLWWAARERTDQPDGPETGGRIPSRSSTIRGSFQWASSFTPTDTSLGTGSRSCQSQEDGTSPSAWLTLPTAPEKHVERPRSQSGQLLEEEPIRGVIANPDDPARDNATRRFVNPDDASPDNPAPDDAAHDDASPDNPAPHDPARDNATRTSRQLVPPLEFRETTPAAECRPTPVFRRLGAASLIAREV